MRPCHGRDRGFESRRLRQNCRCGGIGRRARLRTVSGNHSRWEFESPHLHHVAWAPRNARRGFRVGSADVAQEVEHVLGKDEVTGSSPVISSRREGSSVGQSTRLITERSRVRIPALAPISYRGVEQPGSSSGS